MSVDFAQPATPRVTAVMVVYGGYDNALATLASLAATADVDVEVVVVDNASPDGAGTRLANDVRGAHFVLHEGNLGYGPGVNLGVLYGSAPYALILNSDLSFEPGWLSALVGALDADRSAGAAVPLYVDGTGGVVDGGQLLGADARGYAYGDTQRVGAPEVSFSRTVDFGAAAAMLVRRDAFDVVGGFDPIYGLGYYEDTDLGFALRAAGFHTRFVPAARVVHTMGGSFTSPLRRRLLARNRPVFVERWAAFLRGRPLLSRPPFDPHRDLIMRDWWAPRRFLVLDETAALRSTVASLRQAHPDALVTWVTSGVTSGLDVECLPLPAKLDRFLEDRRFHYTDIVTAAAPAARVASALDRSQPQAIRSVAGGG
jgi:GT2 family glycosyltransferase